MIRLMRFLLIVRRICRKEFVVNDSQCFFRATAQILLSKYTYDKGLITVNDLANAISTYCFVGSNLTNNYVVNDQPVQV